jgi:riboflavin kinase/FMN adenylyltransferase
MTTLVVIGNFDGVHRGHQSVLAEVGRMAAEKMLPPRLLTFEPHPAVTLGREAPPLLTRFERKRELAERCLPGLRVVALEFTPAFAAQSPEEFAAHVLVDQLEARAVVVGGNFRFGKGRAGDIATLTELGARHGFLVDVTKLVGDADGAWSSTRVRRLIAAGDVEAAAAILGRPHMLSGTVGRGAQRGRTLGFPTCNVADAPEALPRFGVYAVLVDRVEQGKARALAKGVANIGVRPTIAGGDGRPLIEVHLFDYQGDLYGAELRVHLVACLREERRFDGLDALVAQIHADSARARELLAASEPDPTHLAWA